MDLVVLDSYVTTSTLVCKGREGVGGRALKFLIMGNFQGRRGVEKVESVWIVDVLTRIVVS